MGSGPSETPHSFPVQRDLLSLLSEIETCQPAQIFELPFAGLIRCKMGLHWLLGQQHRCHRCRQSDGTDGQGNNGQLAGQRPPDLRPQTVQRQRPSEAIERALLSGFSPYLKSNLPQPTRTRLRRLQSLAQVADIAGRDRRISFSQSSRIILCCRSASSSGTRITVSRLFTRYLRETTVLLFTSEFMIDPLSNSYSDKKLCLCGMAYKSSTLIPAASSSIFMDFLARLLKDSKALTVVPITSAAIFWLSSSK